MVGLLLHGTAQAQITVVNRQPGRHAVAAAPTTAVSIGFSQPISVGSASNLRIYGSQLRGKRPGRLSGGGTASLTFTPEQAFFPGELVSVSLPPTMVSTAGTPVIRHVFQFTAATAGTGKGYFLDTTIVGNTGNRDQVLGDLDNDGDLDLVTTGALYGCRVFLNNGEGKFSFKTGFTAAETPGGVTLADVDQDGDQDILAGDAKNNTVTVCLNDGTGEFLSSISGAQNAPVGQRPVGVASGDIDGDGDVDFVTANTDGNSSTIYFNGGPNAAIGLHYFAPANVAMGAGPTAVALADIDNDGDLDLLTSNAGTSTNPIGEVHVSRNSGMGTFGPYTSVAVGLQPSELILADVDGDGDLDLLTANAGDASVSLRLNTGSGTFSGTATFALPLGSTPSGLRSGDVDSDGDLDVVVAQGLGGRVFTYLNTAGTFTLQSRALRLSRDVATPSTSEGVTLGDVDGDGDLDLITSNPQGQVILSLNVGRPPALPAPAITSLTPSAGPVGAMVTLRGAALTDVTAVSFNGTPAPGFELREAGAMLRVLVPAGASSGLVTVTTADAGMATSPSPFTVTIPVPVRLTETTPLRNTASVAPGSALRATFTAPITAATAANMRVFGNHRQGQRQGEITGAGTNTLTFTPTLNYAPGERISVSLPSSLQSADGNQVVPQVIQFTAAVGGTGRHDFLPASTLDLTATAKYQLADLDSDGDMDLAVPSGSQGVQIQFNNGVGEFTRGAALTAPSAINRLTVGDVDGDGDQDIISATANGMGIVWSNNGTGSFSNMASVQVGSNSTSLALADIDGDGDLDLVITLGSAIRTLLNDGKGNFSAPRDQYPGLVIFEGAMGDVDGDGDLDLVLPGRDTGSGQNAVVVALNDGMGTFRRGLNLPRVLPSADQAVLADLDADGDLDLALKGVNNLFEEQIVLYFNDGRGSYTNSGGMLPLAGQEMAVADADADGDLDVITYAGVGINNGDGRFTKIVTTTAAGSVAALVAVGDVDGDGDLDLLTNDEPNRVRVKLNRPGPPPTLTNFWPGSGPVGTNLLLTGQHLGTAAQVTLNGLPASYSVISPGQLSITVPAGATSGLLVVTTPAGTISAPAPFIVTPPLALMGWSPTPHTQTVARSAALSVTFTQPVTSGSASQVLVFGNRRGGKVPGVVTGGGTRTLTFTPIQKYAAGEALTLTLPDRVFGPDGSRAPRQVAQFTIAAAGNGSGLLLPGAGRSLAAFNAPGGFAVGDLDLDGNLDLVTSSGTVRFNNGEGAFPDSTGSPLFTNPIPRGIAVADIDGDGDGDLLSFNGQVYVNNGSRRFTRLLPLPRQSEEIMDMAVGDLDSDGDLDLAVLTVARDSVSIRLNDGAGQFPVQLRVAVGPQPLAIRLGDVDNDGDLDFITANAGSPAGGSSLSVALNNGSGWFARVSSVATILELSRLVLGDVDGDRDLDIVTNTGLVYLNDGTGTYGSPQATAAGQDLALADMDADGDLDLIVVGAGASILQRNDGTGQFRGKEEINLGSTSRGYHPTVADLDGDGDLDLLTANRTTNAVHIFLNQRLAAPSAIRFSPASDLPGSLVVLTGTDLIGTTRVTFNGTEAPNFTVATASRIEVVVPAGASSGLIQVTNPQGEASSPTAFTVLAPIPVLSVSPTPHIIAPRTAAVTVRFGQDLASNFAASLAVFSQKRGGRLEGARTGGGSATLTFTPERAFEPGEKLSVSIPATTTATQGRVLKRVYEFTAAVGGEGRGFFGKPTPTADGGERSLLADVNNDGLQDVLLLKGRRLTLRLNVGGGEFGSGTELLSGQTSLLGDMTLGDVDGDGDLDLAVADPDNKLVQLRLNDGKGTFVPAPNVTLDDMPVLLSLADFDGDGDLDLLTVNAGLYATSTSLRLNDGTGKFSGSTNELLYPQGLQLGMLKVGDLDGDGDLDLVITYSITNYVRLNDGHGHFTFADRLPFSLDIGSPALELVDVDLDGDLDAVGLTWRDARGESSGVGWAYVNVCLNDGRANFNRTGFWAGRGMDRLAVGDVDADGAPDLVLTSANFNTGQVLKNKMSNGQATFTSLFDFAVPDRQYRPLLSDVDADGDLDLVHTFPSLSLQFNNPAPALAITGFTPPAGPAGTSVRLTGSGFVNVTSVHFNGVPAPDFRVLSPTELTVKVPAAAVTGPLSVTAAGGKVTSAMVFTVQSQESIVRLTPGPNALNIPREGDLRLTFSAGVTTTTRENLRVFGNQLRGRRPGQLSGEGTPTLRFTPAQAFAPGEQVSVTVPATLLTVNGGVVRKQVYQFTAATGGPGLGVFRAGSSFSTGMFPLALAIGDLDNDGDLDLVNASQAQVGTGYGVTVQLNDGAAQFTPGVRLSISGSSAVSFLKFGDLDGDGDLDMIASTESQQGSVFFNRGDATFTAAEKLSLSCGKFEFGDLDGDGDLDMMILGNAAMTAALNDGQGRFSPHSSNTTLSARMVVLGDVDGDGDLDALTANGTESVVLHLNDGNGGFEYSDTLPRLLTAHNLALGDLDGDGDLDVVVGYNENVTDGWMTSLVNDGSGRFTSSGQRVAVGRLVEQISLVDVDHDGDLDVMARNTNSWTIGVRLNNGAGIFSGTQSMPIGSSPSSLALGDLDGDGDVDFAVTHGFSVSPVIAIGINESQMVLGTTPVAASAGVMLYPNPAHEQFSVRIPTELRPAAGLAFLRLYNALGQLVVEERLHLSVEGEQVMQVTHLPPGIYTLRIPLKGQVVSYKLLVN